MSANNQADICENKDTHSIPQKKLYTGAKMPAIGLGTFGSDRYSGKGIAEAVKGASAAGYRHFDCASVYGNEAHIGHALNDIIKNGIMREELWITSKLWNDKHAKDDVIPSCIQTLKDLQLDYLDLYIVHWPFPNSHTPNCDVTSRSCSAKPYIHEDYMKTWEQMEKLVKMGLVKHIGTSNMSIPKLKLLLRDATIKPACNQMELHPHFQQSEFLSYLMDNDIIPVGFCPLGSPSRPERDRVESDTVDMDDPAIVEIANRLKIHPAMVCIKWAVQNGQVPIPFSVKKNQYISNLKALSSPPLTNDDMETIKSIDKNCRLIKGQVFLWKKGQNVEDLWDVNGEITLI